MSPLTSPGRFTIRWAQWKTRLNVLFKPINPICGPCLRSSRTSTPGMSVPKASVHDYPFLQLWEDQVWSSRQVPVMEEKTVPQTVGQARNNEFRLGVLLPHVKHQHGTFRIYGSFGRLSVSLRSPVHLVHLTSHFLRRGL